MPSEKDLNDFLQKVDDLQSVLSGLNSADEKEQNEAITKADKMIKVADKKPVDNTGFSRTVINKIQDSAPQSPAAPNQDEMDQAAFMKVLEADAAERAGRRRKNQKAADELRRCGNTYFQDGDYDKAYELYTEALGKIKDDTAIYTNRAQALIKLGRFTEALSDCDWALRVDDNCVKAWVHQGRSYLGLEKYVNARHSYSEALKRDISKKSIIEDYLAEVDRCESAAESESLAKSLFAEGNNGVTDIGVLLEKVVQVKELPVYYGGGFSMIAELMKSDNQRTIFRTMGGLELCTNHAVLKRCLEACPKSLSQEELQMLASAVHLFTVACTENEKNQELMLGDGTELSENLVKYLECSSRGHGLTLKSNILSLLQTLSMSHIGRTKILTLVPIPRLMSFVLTNIRTKSVGTKGMAVLNNLSLHPKFKSLLRGNFDQMVLRHFTTLLVTRYFADNKDNSIFKMAVAPLCITMVTNLSADETMRRMLSECEELWDCSGQILTHSKVGLSDELIRDVTHNLIGLMINVSNRSTQPIINHGPCICTACWDIYESDGCTEEIKDRCLHLVSNLLVTCPPCVLVTQDRGAVSHLIAGIEDHGAARLVHCVKGVSACTQASPDVCRQLVDQKFYERLVSLLNHADETVVGNAALSLGHCSQLSAMCHALVDTNIIMDLLTVARDAKKEATQQNCAILVAKLCRADQRHLERLRELHGLEILHMAAKAYRNI